MDDDKALARLRRGDEKALVWFLEQYAPYVSAVLAAMLGPGGDREELASDVFLALWTSAEKVAPGKVKAWLGAVARNKARDRLRQQRGTLPLEEEILSLTCPGPEEAAEDRELAGFLREAVLDMEETDRAIFLRHYYLCQTVTAIATALNMNPSTVKARLRRGREKLRRKLREGGYLDENDHF